MVGFFLGMAVSLLPFLPSSHDKHGWGLRVHGLTNPGPFLAGERLDQCQFRITLINFSDKVQYHDPIPVAYQSLALDLIVKGPDGKDADVIQAEFNRGGRDPFTVQTKLPPKELSSLDFGFAGFGYRNLVFPGRYRVEAKFSLNNADGKLDGRVVSAPTVEFEVLPLKSETVLANNSVPVEGWVAKQPVEKQQRSAVQQVKAGDRTFLVYRVYHAPKHIAAVAKALGRPVAVDDPVWINYTFRLAELPGKCEMTVAGAYGGGNPLTITYKTSPTAEPTKLVINSIDGRPWTEEEERLRQERLKKDKTPPAAPAPKLVKP